MSVIDEAMMMSSRYKTQYHTRDGSVLPPTMTSRRFQPATVSVVNMSLAMDVDCSGLALARHQHCYDDPPSTRHRARRRRRRRRHDDRDDVELMDTVDHVTDDVIAPPRPAERIIGYDERAARRSPSSQPKWTSSRYLLTHADRRRRRAAKSRHHHVINDVTRHHAAAADDDDNNYEFTRRTTSSPVRRTTTS